MSHVLYILTLKEAREKTFLSQISKVFSNVFIENNPSIHGPAQFKPLLLTGQPSLETKFPEVVPFRQHGAQQVAVGPMPTWHPRHAAPGPPRPSRAGSVATSPRTPPAFLRQVTPRPRFSQNCFPAPQTCPDGSLRALPTPRCSCRPLPAPSGPTVHSLPPVPRGLPPRHPLLMRGHSATCPRPHFPPERRL